MTENNAIIEIIKETCSGCYGSDEEPQRCEKCAYQMALDALKEIQQYRAIGTVEEIQRLTSKGRAYDQVAYERDIAIEQLEEIGLSFGQNTDEVRTAVERMKPYKPKEYEDRYYACKCGNPLLHKWDEYPTKLMKKSRGYAYCLNCGQALDWSE